MAFYTSDGSGNNIVGTPEEDNNGNNNNTSGENGSNTNGESIQTGDTNSVYVLSFGLFFSMGIILTIIFTNKKYMMK